MAKLSACLLLIIFITTASCISTSSVVTAASPRSSPRRSRLRAYIEASCKTTRYPALCVHCLSTYIQYSNTTTIQTPKQLAQVALKASLNRALYTRAYLMKAVKEMEAMKPRDGQAVRDCLKQIDDSVEQLSQAMKELRGLGEEEGGDVFWRISNVETWVSAALTDASSCADAFPGGTRMSKFKATVKTKVLNVAQATSNALALFHRFASRFRSTTKPWP